MENKIKTISNSQIGQWIRCQRQWEFRYVKGLKVPPSGASVQGTAYHGGVGDNFRYKITSGVDMPIADVLDAYSTHWTAETTNPREETEDGLEAEPVSNKIITWEDKDPGEIKDEGIRILKLYHEAIAPTVKPVAVEKKSEIKIGDVLLIGYIDVEELDLVIDHKLRSRSVSQSDADKELQPYTYKLLTGKSNFAFHVAVKKKQPELQVVRVTKTANDIDWYLNMVNQIISQMRTGVCHPNPTGWLCNERFCGYWKMCKEMTKRTYIQAPSNIFVPVTEL